MSPKSKKKKEVDSPRVISSYSSTYNGVDRKDRDTSDWTVSVNSHRWYLRLYYWKVDAAIHSSYLLVVHIECQKCFFCKYRITYGVQRKKPKAPRFWVPLPGQPESPQVPPPPLSQQPPIASQLGKEDTARYVRRDSRKSTIVLELGVFG
jgi:hypothetical protein